MYDEAGIQVLRDKPTEENPLKQSSNTGIMKQMQIKQMCDKANVITNDER